MNISYSEKGDMSALPLVLIHAFPLNRRMWTRQMDGLSDKLRTLAPDLPGFGETPVHVDDQSMAAYVKKLKQFLDGKGIYKAVFAGCSMGGYVLFEFWRTYPDTMSGMILCDTRAEADTEETKANRMKSIEDVREKGIGPLAETMIPKLLSSETVSSREELVSEVREIILSNTTEGVANALAAMAERPDSTDTLNIIDIPTLLIAGKEDIITPPEVAENMQTKMKNARVEIIPGAGHLSPIERPELVNQSILFYPSWVIGS